MKRARLQWAVGVVAPWGLALGLLVSITADAGQIGAVGGSFAALSSRAAPEPDDLIPAAMLAAHQPGSFAGFAFDGSATPVTFDPGTGADFQQMPDDVEPRQAGKDGTDRLDAGHVPAIDRSRKSDPAIGLRPTFDSQLRRRNGARNAQLLGPRDETMPAASFSLADEGTPLDEAASFAPYAEGEDMQGAAAANSGAMRPAALLARLAEGATPPVSRADALSSTTPDPSDGTPVAAVFPSMPGARNIPLASGRPNYAALLTGERGARERRCLAEAVYFESRSEPEDGQTAVAQVVLNRATSGLYPASICGVVYQNRSHYKACQFSFACEGKSLRITDADSWRAAVRVADAVVDGRTYLSALGGATHYHANYVRPGWARRLVKMEVIGHHIFYKTRQGQS